MVLPPAKTKIVATIGPASESPEMLERLVRAGMSVARLNFSHGEFAEQAVRIARIRDAERITGRSVAILADLPGPKMRLGVIDPEPIHVAAGDAMTLTIEDVVGTAERVAVSFAGLPGVVTPGDRLFLSDGLVQLVVERVADRDVHCTVAVGGELRSRKGLNLPGIELGIPAFTEHDRACLEFALDHGVDAVGQSFVESAADVEAVRAAARAHGGRQPFIVAKIERSGALRNLGEILAAADGLMVARGDLGVEVPIEEIAILQKRMIALAGRAGKPVITATQMLESMITSRLPTRAEATDVANAILDGTDCVMLSGESAIGAFPEEAVAMLAAIAARVEAERESTRAREPSVGRPPEAERPTDPDEAIADVVERAIATVPCGVVFAPTHSGATARMISRFKPPVWIVAVSQDPAVCRGLAFSYGVIALHETREIEDWRAWARRWFRGGSPSGELAVLVSGPSPRNPDANYRVEFLRSSH